MTDSHLLTDLTQMSGSSTDSSLPSDSLFVDKSYIVDTIERPVFQIKQLPPLTMMELVAGINQAVGDKLDLNMLHSLMSAYDSSLNEWRRFAFNTSSKRYTRNLIATDHTNFSLMLLCWNSKQASPVHNHSGSECFMRVIDGSVQESQYAHVDGDSAHSYSGDCDATGAPLKLLRRGTYGPGSVLFINDSIGVHKIDNALDSLSVTLHCYLPPYDECNCYDEATGAAKVAHTTFYSEHGEVIEHES